VGFVDFMVHNSSKQWHCDLCTPPSNCHEHYFLYEYHAWYNEVI